MLWAATGLLLAMLVMVRNAYGALSLLLTGAIVVAVSLLAGADVQAGFAYAVTWFLLLAGVRPVGELWRERRRWRGQGRTDADQLARLTRVPGGVWVGFFGLGTLGGAGRRRLGTAHLSTEQRSRADFDPDAEPVTGSRACQLLDWTPIERTTLVLSSAGRLPAPDAAGRHGREPSSLVLAVVAVVLVIGAATSGRRRQGRRLGRRLLIPVRGSALSAGSDRLARQHWRWSPADAEGPAPPARRLIGRGPCGSRRGRPRPWGRPGCRPSSR